MTSSERPEPSRRNAAPKKRAPAFGGGHDPIRSFFARLANRYTLERDRHTVDEPGKAESAAAARDHGEPLVDELVRSMLQWEAGHAQARAAYQRLLGAVIDYNELRICFPRELAEVLGPRYPLVDERCERLCAALNDIASREQSLTLEPLAGLSKREARQHVDSISGLPRFAIARLMLFGFGAHAFPLDQRLLNGLVCAGLFDPNANVDAAASKIERSVRAGEAADAYDLLELWSADAEAQPGAGLTPQQRKPHASQNPPSPRANG